jgi:ubiquinone/menaquinone biosynthesis C-methylase UbiE
VRPVKKPTKSAVAKQFGARAGEYAASPSHAAGPDLEILVRLLDPTAADRVLDVATGPGHTAAAIAPRAREVVAVDLAPEMVERARVLFASRGLPNARTLPMDAEALDFPDRSFDAVTCRIAPHHFIDIGLALREIARVLRPSGRFILEDSCAPADPVADRFVNEIETLRDPTHVRSYTQPEWRAMLLEAGFRLVHAEIHRKEHPVDEWLARAGTSPEVRERIRRRMLECSPSIRDTFAIDIQNGRPVRFTDEKLILRADRL